MIHDKRKDSTKRLATHTLGCKVNQYDTEAVIELFKNKGYELVEFDQVADVYIVNTCTVTHLSDRKGRQMLRKTKKLNPESVLVAMGCYAQASGEQLKKDVPEVDLIVGTNKRNEIVEMVEQFNNHLEEYNYVENIMDVEEFEELQISSMGEHTRAYLKIQEGCNNYCTYCIIPYVRGKIRSRKLENVISEAKRLIEAGFKEIVLTGIHVASYGKDLDNVTLLDAIRSIHDLEGLERIRLSSIEPVVVTDAFLEALLTMPKLCRHFHLSLQSGCDSVLKRMNRKYTTMEYANSVKALREIWPDVAITTDIIVGFPGETEEEFEDTLEFAKTIQFAQVHLFPYSIREGTRAASMPNQIQPSIKDERVKKLKEITDASQKQFLMQHVGHKVEVLWENQEEHFVNGYTSNYLKVKAQTKEQVENTIQLVEVEEIVGDTMVGSIVKSLD